MKDNKTLEKQEKRKKLTLKVVNGILIGIMIAIAGITIFGMINTNCKSASAETKQARESDNRQWEEYPKQWTQVLPYLKMGENYNKADPEETFLSTGIYDLDVPIIIYEEYVMGGESEKEILIAKTYRAYTVEESEEDWYEIQLYEDNSEKHITLRFSKLQELTTILVTTNDDGDEDVPNGKVYIVEMETDNASGTQSEKLKKILWEVSYTSVFEVWYDKGVEVSYETGYNDGYNKGYGEASKTTFNPIGMIITPVATFFNTPMFGEFSIGSFFVVALFVTVAIIFLKIFAGG